MADATADALRRGEAANVNGTSADLRGPPATKQHCDSILVRVDAFVTLGHLRSEDLTAGRTPAEPAEVLRARESVTALRVHVAELTGPLTAAEQLSDTLRYQLAQRD